MSTFVSIEKGLIPPPSHPLVGLRIICATDENDRVPFNYNIPTIRVLFKNNVPFLEHNLENKNLRLKAGSLGFWLQTPKAIKNRFDSFDSILFTEKRWSKSLDFYSIKNLKENSIIASATGTTSSSYMDGPLIHIDKEHLVKNFIPEGGPGRIIFSGQKQESKGVDLSKIKELYEDNSQIYKRCFSSMLRTFILNPAKILHLSTQSDSELIILIGLVHNYGVRLNISSSLELTSKSKKVLKSLSIDRHSVKIMNAPEDSIYLEHFSKLLNQDETAKLSKIFNL